MHERRVARVAAPAVHVWACVAELGGDRGWYAANRLWRLRGLADRAVGGPGERRRPERALRVGDPVGGWRVSAIDPGRRLALVSEMRLPGTALLAYEVQPTPGGQGCHLVQHVQWHPSGVLGRVLWLVELPAHVWVMRSMLRGTARAAERHARAAASASVTG